MKPKHHGVCSLMVILTAFAACCGYYLSDAWRQLPIPPQGPPAVAADVAVPSANQLETMTRLSPKLAAMAHPAGSGTTTVPMALFGYRPAHMTAKSGQAAGGNKEKAYLLSLTLVSGPKRYCILNGRFFAEGDVLEDGAAVVRIENRRVLLVRKKEKQWIALNDEEASTDHDSIAKGKGPS